VSAEWEGNIRRVVPFQFKTMASRRLGNRGSDLVRDTFPDEVKCAFIGSYCVDGQFTTGVGEEHRPDARNYHARLRVGEGHLLEPVKLVPDDVHPQGRIDGSDREGRSNHVKERDPLRLPLPKRKVTVS
jgi:hypothetical protein